MNVFCFETSCLRAEHAENSERRICGVVLFRELLLAGMPTDAGNGLGAFCCFKTARFAAKKRDPIPQKRFFPADAGRYGVHVHGVIIVMLGEANERISLLERVV